MRSICTLRLLAIALAALATCATAAGAAAPRWSAPATFEPAFGVGACLRDAGTDRLALLGELTDETAATDLLAFSPGADPVLAVQSTATLGWLLECADVALPAGGSPDTPPLFAAPVHEPGRASEVRAGAPGAPPVTLRRTPRGRGPTAVRVAVAGNGAAIVIWIERRSEFNPERPDGWLMAAYRPRADAAFEAATALDRQVQHQAIAPPVLGIDAAGRATVAWHGDDRGHTSLVVAESDVGGRFGPPQPLGRRVDAGPSALAVAPDGRALLVTGGWEGPSLYERRASGAAFAAVPGAEVSYANETAVALGHDGAAVVVTQQGDHVVALHRVAGARRFRTPQSLAGKPTPGMSFVEIDTIGSVGDRPQPADPPLSATLGARFDDEGRALLTWTRPATRWHAAAAMAAVADSAGRFADAAPLGSRCRAATAVRPLPLGDGAVGVAWTDLGRMRESGAEHVFGYASSPSAGDGRVNVVVPRPESAAAAAAPQVTARLIGRRALRVGAPLRLRVRCPRGGAPCAVRAVATARTVERRDGRPRRFDQTEMPGDATTLAPGAATVLRFDPSPGMRIAPLGRGHARIALTSCAPVGRAVTRSELRPRVRGLPRTPPPRLVDVAARRSRPGGAVRVTGRLSRSAPGARLVVLGAPDEAQTTVVLRGRTSFGVTLDRPEAGQVRSVTLLLMTEERWNADQVTVGVG